MGTKAKTWLLSIGAGMSIFGSVQCLSGFYHKGIAKHEASVVGKIVGVHQGKSTSYEYVFRADGLNIDDSDDECRTGLTARGCQPGAPVRVYYDSTHLSRSLLNEYGAQSREEFGMARWLIPAGLILLIVLYLANRFGDGEEDEDESDHEIVEQGPEILHVVPDSKT